MAVMILLIAFSLSIATAFLIAFIVSTKSGQFDDVHTPSIRMLFEDEKPKTKK
ncbi:MAG: cbb3-type cytochrome oxidase assembly protein CcoS [Bacteroidetes bacterium]|jgi:cbb3-type cytochrome oxidase maturation protein|nr:cbb3-type cytochrome oxidase assembly protein CcoS [Bacteroidota bacterium]MBK6819261.1 cbb3-type cytochrome oxidase assembly protein CcoS [Bacteroidota bacterium]MBK7041645.1 cbb3-type cytochrome oxidase assembly protein CcoS [Bacteroidota bacterium]MBK8330084.1 cbb3-type cytochrome oxidase assembly protein CcoS [Bacteroidota bacterium]MBK9301168.1 cbb3-type cytochrome oxidase assembly protein CcoS [Bacteroidota bacterium]